MPFLLFHGTAVTGSPYSRAASLRATGGVRAVGQVVGQATGGVLVSWVAFEVPARTGGAATVSRTAALGATARVTGQRGVVTFQRTVSLASYAYLNAVGQGDIQLGSAAFGAIADVNADGAVFIPAVTTRSAAFGAASHVTVVGGIKGVTIGRAALAAVSGVRSVPRRVLLRSVLVHGVGGARANGSKIGISGTHPPLSGTFDSSSTGGIIVISVRGARPAVARGGVVVQHSRGGRVVEHPRGGEYEEEGTSGIYDLVGTGGEVY